MTTNPLEELAANLLLASSQRGETAELPSATLDLDRQRRCGFGEVVYGEGKPLEVLVAIFTRLLEAGQAVLATRISAEKGAGLLQHFSAGRWNEVARTFRVENVRAEMTNQQHQQPILPKRGKVAIITAGTSDLPVAAEAQETADWMGVETVMVHDVGVAGPQRLLAKLPLLAGCDAIVVVAGMEAALASVVGGHVDCPVVAVPTSVGYGASFGGLAALLGMLNSCASNVTVVNIDAGFKGGYVAGLIASRAGKSV